MGNLKELQNFAEGLKKQDVMMPVLFTSHGNPMDIPLDREERPFWKALYELGLSLQKQYELKGVVVVSAHWCTRGTFVNSSYEQTQIYDYYGFPEEYYEPKYQAHGAPEIAHEIKKIVPEVQETSEWGLDHGAWPMLMHLFPEGNVPVFQLSIDYYASPEYHFALGRQLQSLREKGVLIIGSGSLIHNLRLAMQKMRAHDNTPYGWEAEYDAWLKEQINLRNVDALINYESSHKLGKLAAPTPDHFVPVLYTLGLMNNRDAIQYFYDESVSVPAFSERSFILKPE
ncbi:dioxygenase [Marinilongibacter aquaticus]|uniref:dioxygenase family protein n=1 Tax=Marinilongibacter aquaticus TaxID=2975157 RepID=UPI0021BD107F|nr:class III extradiol ring-cleavage dioxygenase [Marinilongibacter aquaticus]UBM58282.1 dioxygenase [Marinilongibacter aquaticus]